jgi:PAS domain S-box-containing protein
MRVAYGVVVKSGHPTFVWCRVWDTLGPRLDAVSMRAPIRRRASRREQKLESALLSSLEHTTDGFAIVDADWRITYVNAAAERMDGVQRREVVGKNYFEVFPAIVGTAFEFELRRVMVDRVPARIESFFEPSACWIEMQAHPAEDGGVFFFRRDVTERRKADEEFRESEREARSAAERANHTKDEFLAVLSHELRTPIDNVLLWAQLLGSGKLDPSNAAAAIEAIERSVKKQVRLIDDLLDVSRIASGKMRIERTWVDVRAVLRAALEGAKPAAQAKGVALREVTVGVDFGLGADASRLEQVLANLLTNAVKFTDRGGEVEVHLEKTPKSIEIAVRDNGQGIDPEFLPQVFERFRQADRSATRRHGGLGLGLAIVKELVELHGGTIRAHSDGRGRGATFSVSLPLTDAGYDEHLTKPVDTRELLTAVASLARRSP